MEGVLAFENNIVQRTIKRADFKCQGCGRSLDLLLSIFGNKRSPLWAHSATTMHIVLKNGVYVATAVPDSHGRMLSRPIPDGMFLIQQMGYEDDAFSLCHDCHKMVHFLATQITYRKLRAAETKNAIPHVLENITLSWVLNGAKWTF